MSDESKLGAWIKLTGTLFAISTAILSGLWFIFGVTANASKGAKTASEVASIKAVIGQLTQIVDHGTKEVRRLDQTIARVDEEQRRRGERLGNGAAQFEAIRERLNRLENKVERHHEAHKYQKH